jgi:hypothetical protein
MTSPYHSGWFVKISRVATQNQCASGKNYVVRFCNRVLRNSSQILGNYGVGSCNIILHDFSHSICVARLHAHLVDRPCFGQ